MFKIIAKKILIKSYLKIWLLISNIIFGSFKDDIWQFEDGTRLRTIYARQIANLIDKLKVIKNGLLQYDLFDYWVSRGFFILPNHFYQPIPDITGLNPKIFKRQFPTPGIDMNDQAQLDLLNNVFSKYRDEFKNFPKFGDSQSHEFYMNNLAFGGLDAYVYYAMIKTFKPKKIIEVGSGWSTKLAAKAVLQIQNCKLYSIEPYPQPFLQKGFPGFTKLIAKKVEEVPLTFFDNLKENDILFIDSSHTVKIGGDVNHIFFNIFPRIKKGVLIHIHDIFIPREYPESYIQDHKFWNEQYLLRAFLMFNNQFEVVYGNTYMGSKHIKDVNRVFSMWRGVFFGGSFWIRRK